MSDQKLSWDDLLEDDDKTERNNMKSFFHYLVIIVIAYIVGSLFQLQLLLVLLSISAKLLWAHYSNQQKRNSRVWRSRRTLQARRNVVRDYEEDSQ